MVLPWIAHVYTAFGAVLALLAAMATIGDDFRRAFLILIAATVIDATDGTIARALRVKERLPHYDGARLDDMVDYLTYVFVPVLLMWRAQLVPAAWVVPIGAAILLASAYGFGRTDAKTHNTDHFFTGFPSYWNVVVLYLFVWRLSPVANAAVLVALALLVFVPLRYVYPSRTKTLWGVTMTLSAAWAALLTIVVWRLPEIDGRWIALSLVYPVYYFALSLWLNVRPQTQH